ncbi:MAG: hypothetical protein AAF939_19190 [Planctomycetota bacterium]
MNAQPSFKLSLDSFRAYPNLDRRIREVFASLPDEVKDDFSTDTCFRVTLDDYQPGKGRVVVMPDLNPNGSSRCVVLKPRLERCSEGFSKYIIAHEFAHSFLHNGGWGEIVDPEAAADAMAAHWGYPKLPYEHV